MFAVHLIGRSHETEAMNIIDRCDGVLRIHAASVVVLRCVKTYLLIHPIGLSCDQAHHIAH